MPGKVLGGIPNQVVSDLGKLSGDILKSSIENLTTTRTQAGVSDNGNMAANKKDDFEETKKINAERDKSALARVQAELEAYRRAQAQQRQEEVAMRQQEEGEKKRVEKQKEQARGNKLSRFFQSIRSTGESIKQQG